MRWNECDEGYLEIPTQGEVWKHVRFGTEPFVTRRADTDEKIYISLESGCEWEPEHGLELVFKEGLRINKVGGYDGHLTNSDAFDDPGLEEVVYHE